MHRDALPVIDAISIAQHVSKSALNSRRRVCSKPLRRNASRTDPLCAFQTEVINAAILELIFACQSMQARAMCQRSSSHLGPSSASIKTISCRVAAKWPSRCQASGRPPVANGWLGTEDCRKCVCPQLGFHPAIPLNEYFRADRSL
jgi:hypothetical protein